MTDIPLRFVALASESFIAEGVHQLWTAKIPLLGGQRPCDLWETDPERVLGWLEGMNDGVII